MLRPDPSPFFAYNDTTPSDYENEFGLPANIDSFSETIKPARDLLVTQFAMGNTIDGLVVVGKGLDSYNYIEKGKWNDNNLEGDYYNDLMFGEKGNDKLSGFNGNDIIYGGEGRDTLIGGIGNDTLIGGENDDTYIINAGDGIDTIEDKQGDNKIMLCYKEIKFFSDTGDGDNFISPDGSQTLKKSTGEVTDVLFNTTVILKEFEWGDFGITLVTLPANPTIENTIIGDLTPVDFKNLRRAV